MNNWPISSGTFFSNLLWLSIFSSPLCADQFIEADDRGFRYTGRFDFSNPKRPRLDWVGAYIEALFQGPVLSVELNRGGSSLNVYVDSQLVSVLDQGSGNTIYPVTTTLADSVHHLLITKRNEPPPVIFSGIHINDGASLSVLPPRPSRKLLVIGDSYSAGYGNESSSRICASIDAMTNNFFAYGPLTARDVEAEYHIIAMSGYGVVRNYGAASTTSPDPLSTYFDKTVRFEQAVWDFNQWAPDVIVFNLGTNDLSTQPAPSQTQFTDGARNFINRVRFIYPLADLIYLTPPTGPLQTYIGALIDEINTADTASPILFLPYSVETNGCDWHPNLAEQRQIADLLGPRVDSIFNERASSPVTGRPEKEKAEIRLLSNSIEILDPAVSVLEIFNLSGERVFEGRITGFHRSFAISGLPPGLYIACFKSRAGYFQSRVILKT